MTTPRPRSAKKSASSRAPRLKAGATTGQKPYNFEAKRAAKYRMWGEAARCAYVEQGLSLEQIARKTKIPVCKATLRRWCLRYGWDAQKEAMSTSPQAHVTDVQMALAKLIEEARTAIQGKKRIPKGFFDEVLKGAKAIEALRGDSYFAGHLLKMAKLLTDYLQLAGQQELLKQMAEILPGFTVWALSSRGQ